MGTEQTCVCQECAKRAHMEKQAEEMHFALLLALIPLMVVTLFGQMGLF
jgi:predicted nucleic acid-binding Zn ribbon protein